MAQRILVIGASGLLGGPVADGLHEAGFKVRVMSRDVRRVRARAAEPFEAVAGDALTVLQEQSQEVRSHSLGDAR